MYENRILIPQTAESMNTYLDQAGTIIIDMRFSEHHFERLLEEFVAVGVTGLAVDDRHRMSPFLPNPHSQIGRLVTVLDRDGRSLRRASAFVQPILREFRITTNLHNSIKSLQQLPYELMDSLGTVCSFVRPFFLGVDYRLQIHCDLKRVIDAVGLVRSCSTDSATRQTLSLLEGMLSGYERQEVASVSWRQELPDRNVATLMELIDNSIYTELAKAAHDIGLRGQARRSLERIRRAAYKLVADTKFSSVLDVASRHIDVPWIKIPESSEVERWFGDRFVPPILNLNDLVNRAALACSPANLTWPEAGKLGKPIRMLMYPIQYWNPYGSYDSAYIEAASDEEFVSFGGRRMHVTEVPRIQTYSDNGTFKAELTLQSGLVLIKHGDDGRDADDQMVSASRALQRRAYRERGSPLGRHEHGFMRWLLDQMIAEERVMTVEVASARDGG